MKIILALNNTNYFQEVNSLPLPPQKENKSKHKKHSRTSISAENYSVIENDKGQK